MPRPELLRAEFLQPRPRLNSLRLRLHILQYVGAGGEGMNFWGRGYGSRSLRLSGASRCLGPGNCEASGSRLLGVQGLGSGFRASGFRVEFGLKV